MNCLFPDTIETGAGATISFQRLEPMPNGEAVHLALTDILTCFLNPQNINL
jgi:hypothetical protein